MGSWLLWKWCHYFIKRQWFKSKYDFDLILNVLFIQSFEQIMTSFGIASLEVLKNAQIDKFIQRLENDLKEKLYFEVSGHSRCVRLWKHKAQSMVQI